MRGGITNAGMLAICNPITRAWRELPPMIHKRLNSLVGVYEDKRTDSYKIVVAGGTCQGGEYECTTEVYDSLTNSWQVCLFSAIHFTWELICHLTRVCGTHRFLDNSIKLNSSTQTGCPFRIIFG